MRIDPRLEAGNAHSTRGNSPPRLGPPGYSDARIDAAEIREARKEAKHEDAVVAPGVHRDGLVAAQSGRLSYFLQVGSELGVVADRYFDWVSRPDAVRLRADTTSVCRTLQGRPRRRMYSCGQVANIGRQWIEVHRNGPERGHDVADAGHRGQTQLVRQGNGLGVDRDIDALGELCNQHGVTSRDDPDSGHCRVAGCNAASRRL